MLKDHYQSEYFNLLEFFKYSHLPVKLQLVSKEFYAVAVRLDALPNNAEKVTAMRKLLESKDCAVRAVIS